MVIHNANLVTIIHYHLEIAYSILMLYINTRIFKYININIDMYIFGFPESYIPPRGAGKNNA